MDTNLNLKGRSILKASQFDREQLEEIFKQADVLEKKMSSINGLLAGFTVASLFYEPSTRTRLSFESAMNKLGGNVIGTENAREFSSAIKGESLEDSIRVIGSYADAIVLRHGDKGASQRAADVSPVPIINAGDGAGEHPTQSLLDLYTIKREVGHIDSTTVLIMGDLKYGRTARSLAQLLCEFNDVNIIFVSPPELGIEDDIKAYLYEKNVGFWETTELLEAAPCADVIYQTRTQTERLRARKEKRAARKAQKTRAFDITNKVLDVMKPDAKILHPLPRNKEIDTEVDSSENAVYFEQAYYGLLIRMVLLRAVLRG